MAAGEGAQLVCLQELTLSPYFAIVPDALEHGGRDGEPLPGGPTHELAARAAGEHGIHVHASLYEHGRRTAGSATTPRSSSGPGGEVVAKTRKLHIPVTAGYYEDKYFRPGDDTGLPGRRARRRALRLPDLLGPVVPGARAGLLARRRRGDRLPDRDRLGARPPRLRHPAAVGAVIVGNGIANGTFMVAVNRIGDRAAADVLRLVVHLRPLRARARAGAARRARGAGGRPRPRPAPRLARAVPVPAHAPARDLRGAARRGRRRPDSVRSRAARRAAASVRGSGDVVRRSPSCAPPMSRRCSWRPPRAPCLPRPRRRARGRAPRARRRAR